MPAVVVPPSAARRGDELERGEQAEVDGRRVVERRAVAARLGALDDERVRAGAAGRDRLVGRRDRGPDGDARVVEAADGRARRAAERERDDGHAQLRDERELLLPAVVVVPRRADLASWRRAGRA